jgi:hypothetical protein
MVLPVFMGGQQQFQAAEAGAVDEHPARIAAIISIACARKVIVKTV